MRLSTPVYQLKRQARLLSRKERIPLHEALDRLAIQEGFAGWSLLAAKLAQDAPATKLYPRLAPGDMIILGARPGQGKTLMSLELAVEAMKAGHRAAFFTFEFTIKDVQDRFADLGFEWSTFADLFHFDGSDSICADSIVSALGTASRGTLVVIDYLQLLDQRRENPALIDQVRTLKAFAKERGLIFVCLSQIVRDYDPAKKPSPGLEDVRLPNPLDLRLFNKACFLNGRQLEFSVAT